MNFEKEINEYYIFYEQEKHDKERTLRGEYLELLNRFENKYLFEFYD